MADIDSELERAGGVVEQFDPAEIDGRDPDEVAEVVESVRATVASLETDHAIAEVFGMAALHPSAHVRYAMLELAVENLDNVFAQEFLVDMCHDDEDFVAFQAIRLLGEHRLQRSIDDIVSLIGWPSERLKQPEGKVGVGGATVLETQTRIFGSDHVGELERLEDHYQEFGHLPPDKLSKPHPFVRIEPDGDADGPADGEPVDADPPDGMVEIPGGRYTVGVDREDLPVNRFTAGDYTEPYEVEIDTYYVDEYPVTNAEYDEFAAEIGDLDHEYCHPSEPDDKDHRRNTLHDDRHGPDHPATGTDYYDAYAYANWAGKDLPIEEEWEIAARGPDGNVFPWGDEWDPDRLNWAGNAFDAEIDTWDEWREVIKTADRMAGVPETTTTPVDAFPEGRSDFGVYDMVGNIWEYTKTNYYSRQEMHPIFEHRRRKAHGHLIEGIQAFPTTRGGTWSSIPEMTTAVYRSSDLMTDRHNEIGFRCVWRP